MATSSEPAPIQYITNLREQISRLQNEEMTILSEVLTKYNSLKNMLNYSVKQSSDCDAGDTNLTATYNSFKTCYKAEKQFNGNADITVFYLDKNATTPVATDVFTYGGTNTAGKFYKADNTENTKYTLKTMKVGEVLTDENALLIKDIGQSASLNGFTVNNACGSDGTLIGAVVSLETPQAKNYGLCKRNSATITSNVNKSFEGSSLQAGSSEEISRLFNRINALTSIRIKLYEALNTYVSNNVNLDASLNKTYTQLNDNITKLETYINENKELINSFVGDKETALRRVEVNNYEYEKYKGYKGLLVILVVACVIVIVMTYLAELPFIPSFIPNIIIVVTIAVAIIMLSRKYINLSARSNQDFSEYDFGGNTSKLTGNSA